MARENRGWGYDRIVGALANLGHAISDRTVGNILRRHNLAPAPERSRTTSWKEFIRSHLEVLAGAEFFTVEVLTWRGLVLRTVLYRIRHPPGMSGRHHAPPGRRLDGASSAQRNHAGQRISERLPLPAARPRPEVLPRVSGHPCGGWRQMPAATSPKSESECLRGALGTFHQRGMPGEADPVRGEVVAASGVELSGTLSPGTPSPRQGQSLAV